MGYELWLDDDTKALNKRYGYNNTVAVLKAVDFDGFSVILVQHVKMTYFSPSGKARLGTKVSYSVRVESPETRETSFDRNWMTAKGEASKYFTQLVKQFKSEVAV